MKLVQEMMVPLQLIVQEGPALYLIYGAPVVKQLQIMVLLFAMNVKLVFIWQQPWRGLIQNV